MSLVNQLSAFLGLTHSLPVAKSRIQLVDQPEVRLIALVVIVVKHFFPFPGPNGITTRPANLPALDWSVWAAHINDSMEEEPILKDYLDVSGDDLAAMTDADQAAYLAHALTFAKSDGKNPARSPTMYGTSRLTQCSRPKQSVLGHVSTRENRGATKAPENKQQREFPVGYPD